MRLNLILFLIFTFIGLINAQDKLVKFKTFNSSNGLSQNNVFTIVQDKLGFIWMGTEDGLNRYDGYNFKVYKKDPNDTSSITGNTVYKCYVDRRGTLWLGTNLGGLNKFDASTESFNTTCISTLLFCKMLV